MTKNALLQRQILIPMLITIYDGAIDNVGEILKEHGFDSVYIFYADGIRELFGERIENSITSMNMALKGHTLGSSSRLEDIMKRAFEIPDSSCLLGIGGGKVIDIVKYTSFLRQIPAITLPTAPSNDSICSPLCPLLIEGKRTTISAKIPYGIISDTSILASSPERFIFSGIGDMVAKVTSIYDWEYEEKITKIYADDFAKMVAVKSIDSVIPYISSDIKNKDFLKILMDALIMSGISMEIAGSSAPASGGEHLISHALDKILERPHLHGIQVGIATYIMAHVQDNPKARIVDDIFQKCGFWEFLRNEQRFNKNGWLLAIENAPHIKPNRRTTIHDEKYRKKVKEMLNDDLIIKELFE